MLVQTCSCKKESLKELKIQTCKWPEICIRPTSQDPINGPSLIDGPSMVYVNLITQKIIKYKMMELDYGSSIDRRTVLNIRHFL